MGNKRKDRTSHNYDLRDRTSWVFRTNQPPQEFEFLFDSDIWPNLLSLHRGYNTKKKKSLAVQCTNQLIKAGLTGHVIADSRDKNNRDASQRIPIWDALIVAGFCIMCRGSEQSGQTTRYASTSKLLSLKKCWELKLLEILYHVREPKIKLDEFSLAMFREGKYSILDGSRLSKKERQKMSLKRYVQNIAESKDRISQALKKIRPSKAKRLSIDPAITKRVYRYLEGLEDTLNEINTENVVNHKWLTYRKYAGRKHFFNVDPRIRQNHSSCYDSWHETGLFTWGVLGGQYLSKATRRNTQIDGEPAAELDSKSHFTRMLYHKHGLEPKGDLYMVEKVFPHYANSGAGPILRALIKKVTNILLFTTSRSEAAAAVYTYINSKEERKVIKSALQTENITIPDLIIRVYKCHPPRVWQDFCSNIGPKLQQVNCQIMIAALNDLVVKAKRPCMPIHDALLVRASDVQIAKEIYDKNYHAKTGCMPILEREF